MEREKGIYLYSREGNSVFQFWIYGYYGPRGPLSWLGAWLLFFV